MAGKRLSQKQSPRPAAMDFDASIQSGREREGRGEAEVVGESIKHNKTTEKRHEQKTSEIESRGHFKFGECETELVL